MRRRRYEHTFPIGFVRTRETEDGPEKVCGSCREWWPLECFGKHNQMPDGLYNDCRACRLEVRHARKRARLPG